MRREEFDSLFQEVMPTAYRYALNLTRNEDKAMDLVQDAAVLAYKGSDGFQPGTNFRAWFLRILTNRFYRLHRTEKAKTADVSLDEAEDLFLYMHSQREGAHEEGADPAGALMDKLDTEAVREAIEGLPEEFRTVALLFFMNDFSYEEIAGIVEVPVGTVRSRLHRGRKLLQRQLWHVALERGIVDPSQEVEHA